MTCKVLIADSEQVFRQGLTRLLEQEKDIEVIGEASTGKEAVRICQELNPDVILINVEMPEENGMEATAEIKKFLPESEVIILTGSLNQNYLYSAIKAGANGYILKQESYQVVIDSIRSVCSGKSLISNDLCRKLLQRVRILSEHQTKMGDIIELGLTKREIEILIELAKGKTNAQIAEGLYVSEKTVKNHVFNLYRKLEVENRSSAVLKAFDLGLVEASTGVPVSV